MIEKDFKANQRDRRNGSSRSNKNFQKNSWDKKGGNINQWSGNTYKKVGQTNKWKTVKKWVN